MKIVLTGSTGFVGGEVLSQLLEHPAGPEVLSLTRRPLERTHPRLTAVVHPDFTAYDDALLGRLDGAGACIWTLGGKAGDFPSLAEAERATHTAALAFARAVTARGATMRFCYLSGLGADREGDKRLFIEKASRRLKGRTEKDLVALEATHPAFQTYCFRPGGILPRRAPGAVNALLAPWVVRVQVVAEELVRVALGGDAPRVLENADLRRGARAA